MTAVFILAHDEARKRAADAVLRAPMGYAVRVGEANRSLDQNAAQWPILEAFAEQRQWAVNGKLEWLKPEEWKDVLTPAFEQDNDLRLAAGWNGGVVMLGKRTSKFGKKKFSAWLDWLNAAAAQIGVEV
jgi:hypothetical protein